MRNIDSRAESITHDRFKLQPPLVLLLRKAEFAPSFSADC